MSVIIAKPKVGKSTFVRYLALEVARGTPFLDKVSSAGTKGYLTLEEISSEVQGHFQRMGGSHDPIDIHFGTTSKDAIPALRQAIYSSKAALAIVDPMLRVLQV